MIRLDDYLKIKREKEHLEALKKELESRMYSARTATITGMPAAPTYDPDKMAPFADKHQELLDWYNAKIAELSGQELEVEQAIDSLEPTMRDLLRYLYIDGLNMEDAAVKINYSYRQTIRIHLSALEMLGGEQNG